MHVFHEFEEFPDDQQEKARKQHFGFILEEEQTTSCFPGRCTKDVTVFLPPKIMLNVKNVKWLLY